MSRLSRFGCRALALVVGVVLLTPATAGARSAPESLRAGPGYHQPEVGQCYDMTWKEADHPSTAARAVPCTERHTLMTVEVVRLPKDVKWSAPGFKGHFFRACAQGMVKALGGHQRWVEQTAFDWWWFIPNKVERSHGARWVRCDMGLPVRWQVIDRLPGDLSGVVQVDPADRYVRCLVGRRLASTPCSHRHQWRVVGSFQLAKRLKTLEEAREAARRRCHRFVNGGPYVFSAPSSWAWRAGDHWVECYDWTTT